MKTSKSNLRSMFKNHQFVIDLSVWSFLIVVSLVLLGILIGTHTHYLDGGDSKTFTWRWITGFILEASFSTLALILIRMSVKVMVRTENYFFYVFLFICRIGLYFIPFLLGYFICEWDIFSLYGILWGLCPLAIIPLSGVIPAMHDVFSHKEKKLLSQAK